MNTSKDITTEGSIVTYGYLLRLIKKYGGRIGETVETPDDEYVSSYKFIDPVNVEISLKGTIRELKIEGVLKWD
jgi:hypothetical protein